MISKNALPPSIKSSLTHIEKMTDNTGILEHCIFSTPDRNEGYSTDDNARALQVILSLNKLAPDEPVKKYFSIYLQFLLSARSPQGFHQDLNSDLTWKDDAGVNEGFGRAMIALGEAASLAPENSQRFTAADVFDQQACLIPTIKHPRVMAQAIIALSIRIKCSKKPSGLKKDLIALSNKLVEDYYEHSSGSWKWYQDMIAYDNGRFPLALFCAFQVTKDQKYLEVARKSLDFLIEQIYDHSKDCFSFVGNKGWYPKDKKPAAFDQQPVDAGSMVEVCAKAYEVIKDPQYRHFARIAFLWYSGKNILGLSMIDSLTGGVYDGLEPKKVNQNEGAEAVLSYALAFLALKETES